MKLDLFKEVKNTLEKLDVQDFINGLSDYLKNFTEKFNHTKKFITITQIKEDYNLSCQSSLTLNKKTVKI